MDRTLLADIGGTNARFALLDRGVIGPIEHAKVSDYPTATDAIAAFLAPLGYRPLRAVTLADLQAHADALAHVARRLLDDALLERRRLHAGDLEVAIGPVGAALERGAEHALQRVPGEAEPVEDDLLRRCGLHDARR